MGILVQNYQHKNMLTLCLVYENDVMVESITWLFKRIKYFFL